MTLFYAKEFLHFLFYSLITNRSYLDLKAFFYLMTNKTKVRRWTWNFLWTASQFRSKAFFYHISENCRLGNLQNFLQYFQLIFFTFNHTELFLSLQLTILMLKHGKVIIFSFGLVFFFFLLLKNSVLIRSYYQEHYMPTVSIFSFISKPSEDMETQKPSM